MFIYCSCNLTFRDKTRYIKIMTKRFCFSISVYILFKVYRLCILGLKKMVCLKANTSIAIKYIPRLCENSCVRWLRVKMTKHIQMKQITALDHNLRFPFKKMCETENILEKLNPYKRKQVGTNVDTSILARLMLKHNYKHENTNNQTSLCKFTLTKLMADGQAGEEIWQPTLDSLNVAKGVKHGVISLNELYISAVFTVLENHFKMA